LADGFSHLSLREATEELEKELIRQALSRNAGNKSLVAKSLHIPKTTLYNKIKRYSL
jgi:transcriptional regulator with PAS, ATPase and Fis domain